MEGDCLFSGLSTALFLVVCMIAPSFNLQPDLYAQGSTMTSLNNTHFKSSITTGDKINLQVEDLSVTISPTDGLVHATGKIRNNATLSVNDVMVVAEFFGKDGSLLDKFDKSVSRQSFVLKPGEVIPFKFLDIIPFGIGGFGKHNIVAFGDTNI